MSEKDNIKELFKDRFEHFEANVDSQAWGNIQSKITSTPVGTSSLVGSVSFWVAAVSISVASVWGYTSLSTDNNKEVVSEVGSVEEKTSNSIVIKSEEVTEPILEEASRNKSSKIDEKESLKRDLEPSIINTEERSQTTISDNNIAPTKELGETATQESAPKDEELVVNTQETVSNAPQSIIIEQQSRVVASPMGGNAPLTVSFHSLASVKKIKWKFDDGSESESEEPEFTYQEPGVYFVTMLAELEDGTIVMDKAVIEVGEQNEEKEVFIEAAEILVPNIFTPNFDGRNDELTLKVERVHSFTISIYSVNGKLVYSSDNSQEGWGGTDLQGNKLEDGVFYYLINAIGDDGNVYAPKGYITIKR